MVDSAGREIVINYEPAWGDSGDWHVVPEPEVRIGGGVDGRDSSHLIWDVTGAAELSDGRIAVLSGQQRTLFLFNRSGELSLSIGSAGRGPGEFSYPQHLQYSQEDTLVVWDAWYGSVQRFDTTGTLLESKQIALGAVVEGIGEGNHTESLTPLPGGRFVAHIAKSAGTVQAPEEGELWRAPLGFSVFDSLYSAKFLGWYEGVEYMPVDMGGGRLFPAIHLFPVRASIAAGGDPTRIYTSNGDVDEIHQFSVAGELVRIIRRDTPPLRISRRERRGMEELVYDLNTGTEEGRSSLGSRLDVLPAQESYPAILDLLVDQRGFLWSMDKPGTWSVFTREGRWLGRLEVPLWRVLWIGEGALIGLNRDDLGLETLEVYQLERGGP